MSATLGFIFTCIMFYLIIVKCDEFNREKIWWILAGFIFTPFIVLLVLICVGHNTDE